MIFAETERLFLRALDRHELPRLAQLIGEWEVVRWISVVPFPYTLRDAEEFYDDIAPQYNGGTPQFYALALKTDNLLIGGMGLHLPRGASLVDGEIEIGYWLGKDYWKRGLAYEAACAVRDIGFGRPSTRAIGASTALANIASQNVLRKIGLREKGVVPRDYTALRGENEVMKWLLTREEYEQGQTV